MTFFDQQLKLLNKQDLAKRLLSYDVKRHPENQIKNYVLHI